MNFGWFTIKMARGGGYLENRGGLGAPSCGYWPKPQRHTFVNTTRLFEELFFIRYQWYDELLLLKGGRFEHTSHSFHVHVPTKTDGFARIVSFIKRIEQQILIYTAFKIKILKIFVDSSILFYYDD